MTTKRQRKYSQDFSGPSETQQQFKESCDVNRIIAHYANTGQELPQSNPANFGFASSQTYSEAMQKVAEVNSAFAELPSDERQLYHNNPEEWLEDSLTPTPAPQEIIEPEAPQGVSEPPEPVPPNPESGTE